MFTQKWGSQESWRCLSSQKQRDHMREGPWQGGCRSAPPEGNPSQQRLQPRPADALLFCGGGQRARDPVGVLLEFDGKVWNAAERRWLCLNGSLFEVFPGGSNTAGDRGTSDARVSSLKVRHFWQAVLSGVVSAGTRTPPAHPPTTLFTSSGSSGTFSPKERGTLA